VGEGWRGHGGNRLRFICSLLVFVGTCCRDDLFYSGVLFCCFVTCARGRVLASAGLAYVACLTCVDPFHSPESFNMGLVLEGPKGWMEYGSCSWQGF
jgi:hypothetical protein